MIPNRSLGYYERLISRVAANQRGFQTEGSDEWINLSKFVSPPPAIPPAGTWVTVGLDRDGFCRSITPVDHPDATPPAPAPTPEAPPTPFPAAPTSRDAQIARMKGLELGLSAQTLLASDLGLATVAQWVALADRLTAYILTGEFPGEGADNAGS